MKMVAMGDDNLLTHNLNKFNWKPYFLSLGFETVSIYRNSIFDAEFCSSIIIPVEEGLAFIPKIGRVLPKLGHFINPPKNVAPNQLLRGVAIGYSALSQIPLFKSLLNNVLEHTKEDTPVFKQQNLEYKMLLKTIHPTSDTARYMRDHFDLSYEQFEIVNVQLLKCRDLQHPFLKLLCDKHTDGFQEVYS